MLPLTAVLYLSLARSVAPMARPTSGPGASQPLDEAAIQELLDQQLRREPATAELPEPEPEPEPPVDLPTDQPDQADRPGLITRLELELDQQREQQEREQERQTQQQEEQQGQEQEQQAEPAPEPPADIRHFSYCYLEKVRAWTNDH